jgi:hypothetical protein
VTSWFASVGRDSGERYMENQNRGFQKIKNLTFKISMVYDEHHFHPSLDFYYKQRFYKKKEVI